MKEKNSSQLLMIYDTLPTTKPKKRDVKYISKTEELFFLVIVQPLQKTYSPKTIIIEKYTRGLTDAKKFFVVSNIFQSNFD